MRAGIVTKSDVEAFVKLGCAQCIVWKMRRAPVKSLVDPTLAPPGKKWSYDTLTLKTATGNLYITRFLDNGSGKKRSYGHKDFTAPTLELLLSLVRAWVRPVHGEIWIGRRDGHPSQRAKSFQDRARLRQFIEELDSVNEDAQASQGDIQCSVPRGEIGSERAQSALEIDRSIYLSRALNCGIVEATTGKTRGHQVPKRPSTPYKTKHYKGWDDLGRRLHRVYLGRRLHRVYLGRRLHRVYLGRRLHRGGGFIGSRADSSVGRRLHQSGGFKRAEAPKGRRLQPGRRLQMGGGGFNQGGSFIGADSTVTPRGPSSGLGCPASRARWAARPTTVAAWREASGRASGRARARRRPWPAWALAPPRRQRREPSPPRRRGQRPVKSRLRSTLFLVLHRSAPPTGVAKAFGVVLNRILYLSTHNSRYLEVTSARDATHT
eukprot:scaffold49199_cov111-Phaeocystis_antarctica.AAC.1